MNGPKTKTGFTLIELIIVIIIVGILAAIAGPMLTSSVEDAKGMRAVANLRVIGAAARAYYYDTGSANIPADQLSTLPLINSKYSLAIQDTDFTYNGNQNNANYNFTAARTTGPYRTATLIINQNGIDPSGTWPFAHNY